MYVVVCDTQLGLGSDIIKRFEECQVDGDLLLLMTEENLTNDIKITNGIIAKRLKKLKCILNFGPIYANFFTTLA